MCCVYIQVEFVLCIYSGRVCVVAESSESDTESDSGSEEEEVTKEELKFKLENPYRMHKEIWYNEAGEVMTH